MESPHKYLLIQRCKPYGVWPKDFLYEADHKVTEIEAHGETYKLTVRLGVKAYDDALFVNNKGGEAPHVGSLVVDNRRWPGFWIGDAVLRAPDELTPMGVSFRNVEPGEVDFFIGVVCLREVPMDVLRDYLSPLVVMFIMSLATRLDDVIVMTAPPMLSKLMGDGRSQVRAALKVEVRDRPRLTPEAIQAAFPAFFDAVANLNAEKKRLVAVAMRRYQDSMSETDLVDRFCDLWETCEFLGKCVQTDSGRKVGGHTDSVIAFVVASVMRRNRNHGHTKAIGRLYDIRKDLVHNAVEDPEGFEGMVQVMEEVAAQMIRYTFSIGPGSAPHLERMLAS